MNQSDHQNNHTDTEEPTWLSGFVPHLVELRNRIIRCITVIFVVFAGLCFKANEIYAYLAGPLMEHLPPGTHMIATGVTSPFTTPLKLALMVAVFFCIPYVLHQAWAFVSPGLYQHEKRFALPLLISSVVLFFSGAAFAHYAAFPFIFMVLTQVAPPGVTMMTDINQYLDFVLPMFLAFGIIFEVPIFTILLVATDIVSRENIADKRPYVIVLAFVIGAILTPPDVISQTMMAVPILLLFEVGLLFSRFFVPKQEEETPSKDITP